jgi:hypothetical protein
MSRSGHPDRAGTRPVPAAPLQGVGDGCVPSHESERSAPAITVRKGDGQAAWVPAVMDGVLSATGPIEISVAVIEVGVAVPVW